MKEPSSQDTSVTIANSGSRGVDHVLAVKSSIHISLNVDQLSTQLKRRAGRSNPTVLLIPSGWDSLIPQAVSSTCEQHSTRD